MRRSSEVWTDDYKSQALQIFQREWRLGQRTDCQSIFRDYGRLIGRHP